MDASQQGLSSRVQRAWVSRTEVGIGQQMPEIAALRQILGTEAEMLILAEECAGTMTLRGIISCPGGLPGKTLLYPDEDL